MSRNGCATTDAVAHDADAARALDDEEQVVLVGGSDNVDRGLKVPTDRSCGVAPIAPPGAAIAPAAARTTTAHRASVVTIEPP